jgi:integrase
MPTVPAGAPDQDAWTRQDARAAIDGYLDALRRDGYAPATRRLRAILLGEFLEHVLDGAEAAALTAGEFLDPDRAHAWLEAAAAGATRRRNTLRGPDARAAEESQRARAQSFNSLAAHLGAPHRIEVPPQGAGEHLTPDEANRLLHTLTVKRPTGANAATSIRTAAVAALVAGTGRTVPELHRLRTADVDLDQRVVHLDTGPHPLDARAVEVLRRWLDVRGHITARLEGSDPGHLWIPTKPGRPRDGAQALKPGINRAAVRTLHSAHRTLVLQLLGRPVRPGALRRRD